MMAASLSTRRYAPRPCGAAPSGVQVGRTADLVFFFGDHELVDPAIGMAALDRLESCPGAEDFPAASGHAAAPDLVFKLDQMGGTQRPQARFQIPQDPGRQIEVSDGRKEPPLDPTVLKGLEVLPEPAS